MKFTTHTLKPIRLIQWLCAILAATLVWALPSTSAVYAADPLPEVAFTVEYRALNTSGMMYGMPVRYQATVTGLAEGAANPTGDITVKINGVTQCAISLASGAGSCVGVLNVNGSYTIDFDYPGDANYDAGVTSTASVGIAAFSLTPKVYSGKDHSCVLKEDGRFSCWGLSANYPASETDQFTSLALGNYHTCGIKTDGTLECWSASTVLKTVPTGKFISVSAFGPYACAVKTDRSINCWGDTPEDITATISTPLTVAVAAGEDHICAIQDSNSQPTCWGAAGNPNLSAPAVSLKSISAGPKQTCGVTSSNALTCWGTVSGSVPSSGAYTSVSSGSDYSCALKTDGYITCWGTRAATIGADNSSAYASMSAGYLHTCALQSDGAGSYHLACWGSNSNNQAPALAFSPSTLNEYLPLNKSWSQVYTPSGSPTAGNYTLAVNSGSLPAGITLTASTFTLSGAPNSIGARNFSLRLSEANVSSSLPYKLKPIAHAYTLTVENPATSTAITNAPTTVTAGSAALVQVSVTESGTPTFDGRVTISSDPAETSCQTTVAADGMAQCNLYFRTQGTKSITASFSDDSYYTGSTSSARTITVEKANIAPAVSVGSNFSCSINADGAPVCWGSNDSGRSTPPASAILSQISAGVNHACGRDLSGEIKCWGWDGYGLISNVPAGNSFVSVGSGEFHSCALTTAGTVQCWGILASQTTSAPTGSNFTNLTVGYDHACVLNSATNAVCWGGAPASAIPSASFLFTKISAGNDLTCGLAPGGAPYCWGLTVPADKQAMTFTAIEAGDGFACGIASDGAAHCWGDNTYGQSTPPTGSFKSISAGGQHACAIRQDDTLVCWGKNTSNQAPSLSITPTTLPTLDLNASWNKTFTAAGGRASQISYSISAGALPTGLTLDSSSGVVSGAPTVAGNYTFTLSAVEVGYNPALVQSQSYQQTVRSQVNVALDVPSSVMAGKPLTVGIQVTETPGTVMGAQPTGAVTLTASDGQSCAPTLSSGRASCTFFFPTPGDLTFSAAYPGDALFLAGATAAPVSFTVLAFTQDPLILTTVDHTYVHLASGQIACNGQHCNAAQFNQKYTAVAAGQEITCALGLNGKARCANASGVAVTAPTSPLLSLAVGRAHACGIQMDETLVCWGENGAGQATPPGGTFASVAAAADYTCGLRSSGLPVCWGSAPDGLHSGVAFQQLALGSTHACGLTPGGAVECWGEDGSGQSTAPAAVFSKIVAADAFTCALDSAGQVACWGDTTAPYGQFIDLAAANDHACALRVGSQKTCWGGNQSGEAPQFSYNPLTVSSLPALANWEHHYDPTGGVKPYQATLDSGVIPQGLDLSFSPAGLVLHGAPGVPGVYHFLLRWQDSSVIPNVLEVPQSLTVTGVDLGVDIQPTHPGPVLANNTIEWQASYSNTSALPLAQADLTVTLPENVTEPVLSLTGCAQNGNQWTCPLTNLAAGSQQAFTISARAPQAPGASITATVAIQTTTADYPEITPTDNQAASTLVTADSSPALEDDFDQPTPDPAWTDGVVETAPTGVQYLELSSGADQIALNLTQLAGHARAKIRFDLYIVGDWVDGSGAPVRWSFGLPGATPLLDTSFCNTAACAQAYPQPFGQGANPARSGASGQDELGYTGLSDTRYTIEVSLDHASDALQLIFGAQNLPAGSSWGIDSFQITLESGKTYIFLPVALR